MKFVRASWEIFGVGRASLPGKLVAGWCTTIASVRAVGIILAMVEILLGDKDLLKFESAFNSKPFGMDTGVLGPLDKCKGEDEIGAVTIDPE